MVYEQFINNFIEVNYLTLRQLSIKKCLNTQFNPDDLLNELVIYLHKNEEKINNIVSNKQGKKDPLLRFSNDWLYNSTNYKANKYDTNFTSKFIVKEKIQLDSINIQIEETSEETIDLHDLSPEQQNKVLFIRNLFSQLNQFEQKLFHYHFNEDLPHYTISERLNKTGIKVSASSIYNLLRELRKKIKEEYDNRVDN